MALSGHSQRRMARARGFQGACEGLSRARGVKAAISGFFRFWCSRAHGRTMTFDNSLAPLRCSRAHGRWLCQKGPALEYLAICDREQRTEMLTFINFPWALLRVCASGIGHSAPPWPCLPASSDLWTIRHASGTGQKRKHPDACKVSLSEFSRHKSDRVSLPTG